MCSQRIQSHDAPALKIHRKLSLTRNEGTQGVAATSSCSGSCSIAVCGSSAAVAGPMPVRPFRTAGSSGGGGSRSTTGWCVEPSSSSTGGSGRCGVVGCCDRGRATCCCSGGSSSSNVGGCSGCRGSDRTCSCHMLSSFISTSPSCYSWTNMNVGVDGISQMQRDGPVHIQSSAAVSRQRTAVTRCQSSRSRCVLELLPRRRHCVSAVGACVPAVLSHDCRDALSRAERKTDDLRMQPLRRRSGVQLH